MNERKDRQLKQTSCHCPVPCRGQLQQSSYCHCVALLYYVLCSQGSFKTKVAPDESGMWVQKVPIKDVTVCKVE